MGGSAPQFGAGRSWLDRIPGRLDNARNSPDAVSRYCTFVCYMDIGFYMIVYLICLLLSGGLSSSSLSSFIFQLLGGRHCARRCVLYGAIGAQQDPFTIDRATSKTRTACRSPSGAPLVLSPLSCCFPLFLFSRSRGPTGWSFHSVLLVIIYRNTKILMLDVETRLERWTSGHVQVECAQTDGGGTCSCTTAGRHVRDVKRPLQQKRGVPRQGINKQTSPLRQWIDSDLQRAFSRLRKKRSCMCCH
jgi:hypothetical protein